MKRIKLPLGIDGFSDQRAGDEPFWLTALGCLFLGLVFVLALLVV